MTQSQPSGLAILKTFWRLADGGRWGMSGMAGIDLQSRPGFDPDFFPIEGLLQQPLQQSLLTGTNIHEMFATMGTSDFLLKQSILPVVAWVEGERSLRCIGTAFVISCTGYLMTACHVLLDPQESGYGRVDRVGTSISFGRGLHMGVIIPLSSAYGRLNMQFFPFETCRYWGEWKESPLFHEPPRFDCATDVAICKIPRAPNGLAHQPLSLSLRSYNAGDKAIALGYSEIADIPFRVRESGQIDLEPFRQDLFASVGPVVRVMADNHIVKEVPTPGPCFDFRARIPGKMSGGPIFDPEGVVVRGVVSRSFSGEKHAFGAMLNAIMHLEVTTDRTLKSMMESGDEGMARVQGNAF